MFHLAPLGTQSNTTWHHQPEPSDGKLPLRLILSSNKVTHDSLSRIRVAGGELWFPLKSKRNSNLVVPQKNQFTSLLVVLNSFTTSACELSMYHIWFYIFPLQSAAQFLFCILTFSPITSPPVLSLLSLGSIASQDLASHGSSVFISEIKSKYRIIVVHIFVAYAYIITWSSI